MASHISHAFTDIHQGPSHTIQDSRSLQSSHGINGQLTAGGQPTSGQPSELVPTRLFQKLVEQASHNHHQILQQQFQQHVNTESQLRQQFHPRRQFQQVGHSQHYQQHPNEHHYQPHSMSLYGQTTDAQQSTPRKPVKLSIGPNRLTHAPFSFSLGEIFMAVGTMWLLLLLPLLVVFAPVVMGVLGLWAYLERQYSKAVREKETTRHLLKITLGSKGLKTLLGEVPSWIPDMEGGERLEWLNKVLHDVWPTFDKPISILIRQTVEPLLDIYKPSFISKLGFKKLSLGDAPIRLEELRVMKETQNEVELEVDFRWRGQPSITFDVELLFIGRYTRMAPRLSDLSLSGTAKIILKPMITSLVPPGFGAVLFSLTKPPLLKFTLNFGVALGGQLSARPVAAFLDPFIRETLANMLVWPQRIVIPLLPESETGPLHELQLRSVGILYVEVLYCRGLPKKGILKRMDPQVELFTQPQKKFSTSIKIKTVHPVWNQHFRLLVQEPNSQYLRLTLYDVETMRAETLLTLNIVKGIKDMIFSKVVEGRCEIPLGPICAQPGELIDSFFTFFSGDWGGLDDADPRGEVRLKIKYQPFTRHVSAREHYQGVLFVDIFKLQDVGLADKDLTPYIIVKVDRETQRTATLVPGQFVFNSHFEFLEVSYNDAITIKAWDNRVRRFDKYIGKAVLPLGYLMKCSDEDTPGRLHRLLTLCDGAGGKLEVALHFKPYERAPG